MKVVSDLKFGHFFFSWPPLTSATSEVKWKTSNFIVDFDVEKKGRFWCTKMRQQRKAVLNCLLFQTRVFST